MKEELIQFIHQAVVDKFSSDRCPLNGAALAELVRGKFPENIIELAGYEKLSHAVRDASERGLIHRNLNVKHLEVLPVGEKFDAQYSVGPSLHQYVRADAWRAFGMQFANRIIYFDPNTQSFDIHTSRSDRADLIEVKPLINADFLEWINDFSAASDIVVPNEILKSPSCLKDFSEWIISQSALLSLKWKKFRTAKVVDSIVRWGILAGVETNAFFTPIQPRNASSSVSECRSEPNIQCDDVRRAIMACIADMSLDELESLLIPLRYVLRHFRPRS